MKKLFTFVLLPVFPIFFSCESAMDNWNNVQPTVSTESNTLTSGQGEVLEVFDTPVASGGTEMESVIAVLDNHMGLIVSDPELSEEDRSRIAEEWTMARAGEPIDRSKYEIPFMPPREEQDPDLSYWESGSNGKVWYYAFPKGLCGPFKQDERYGLNSNGYFCWK